MKKQQSGFTLIELIAVIVILGILAAVAIPKFVDMSDAAEDAALKGVAGGLSSGSSLNYAAAVSKKAGLDDNLTPVEVANCTDVASLLEGGLPDNYEIAPLAVGEGASVTCEVHTPSVDESEDSEEFTAYGVAAP